MSKKPDRTMSELILKSMSEVPEGMMTDKLFGKYSAALESTEHFDNMHSHPLYCAGEWIYEKTGYFPDMGEVFYMIGSPRLLWQELRE